MDIRESGLSVPSIHFNGEGETYQEKCTCTVTKILKIIHTYILG